MIDHKLLQSFMNDIDWWRTIQKSSTSSSSSSEQADFASGLTFKEHLAHQVDGTDETSEDEVVTEAVASVEKILQERVCLRLMTHL